MSQHTLVVLFIIGGFLAWALIVGGRVPVPFRLRSCQGRAWRRSFPDAGKVEIRQFLSLFVSAFAFDEIERLKLNPNDQVLDVYRALYPHRWQADALELETLEEDISRRYGVSLEAAWKEQLTLGELFLCTRRSDAQPSVAADAPPAARR